jgi:sporulation protein YlmC with PRC-barrel domain
LNEETDMRKILPALAIALSLGAAPALAATDSGNAAVLQTVPDDAMTVSNVYKQDVYDTKENKIGDVNDVLLDKDGRITAVIIGVGGFLGVGEKDVAVPFNSLKMAEKDGDAYLVMNTTKETLEGAPGYTYDRENMRWMPAKKQAG